MKLPHEIFYSSERSTSLEWSGNALKVKEFAESSGYGVRVIKNRKVGFASTENAKKISETIEKAGEMALFSPVTRFSFQDHLNDTFKRIETFDKKVSCLDERSLKDFVDEIKEAARKRAKMVRVIAEASQGNIGIKNTEGLHCSYDKTLLSFYVEAMEGKGFGFTAYSGVRMPVDMEMLGTKAGEMANAMKNAGKIKSGNYMLVFSAEAFSQMLSLLMPSLSGDWKRRKISVLHDKIGKRLFHDALSVYEDPLAPASGIRPFDDEGVSSCRIPLIENGIIKNFMFDRETAALARVKNSGFCFRPDYDVPPTAGCSNIVIKEGSWKSFEDELDDFLLVNSIHGLHTANTTTGDFGADASVAFYYKNGREEAKRGFLITGNIFRMLSSVAGIEKRQRIYDNLVYPRIAFREVQVVG